MALEGEEVPFFGRRELLERAPPLRSPGHGVHRGGTSRRVHGVPRDDPPGTDRPSNPIGGGFLPLVEHGARDEGGGRQARVHRPEDPVGHLGGPRVPARPEHAQPDLHRHRAIRRQTGHVEHAGRLAVDHDRVAGQQRAHRRDVVEERIERHGPLTDRHPGRVPGPESGPEPTAGQPRDGGETRGHRHHRSLARDEHRGAEPDPRCPDGGETEVDERVLPQRRAVEAPHPGVAELLGEDRQIGEVRARREPTGEIQNAQRAPPSLDSGPRE